MTTETLLTVVIPTHNPHPRRFARVLEALYQQSLSAKSWELLIIDNASSVSVEVPTALSNVHRPARVIREPQLGLTSARWRGITEASAQLIVFVDDDNVLEPLYLEEVYRIFQSHPRLGAAGGKALPEYEVAPPVWFKEGMAPLGCRDLGNLEQTFAAHDYSLQPEYPSFAPIGAGMALRKDATATWLATALTSPVTDRRGNSLSSAGDCDLVLHVLESGWDVGYFPSLSLTHLMPSARVNPAYLEAISRTAYRDFIRVLDLHGIRPWHKIEPWAIPLRALKAWFTYRVWRGPAERLRWLGAIGQYEGRAALPQR
jgi:glycosyltransferase involved in cell wall biosynthesis